MKLLPYYLEDEGAKYSGSISLAENKNFLSELDAELLCEYMSSGVVIDEWLSNVKDALTGVLEVPSKTWSDGVYVWDSLHIHYVRRYRAKLPKEFIEYVRSCVRSGKRAEGLDKDKLLNDFDKVLRDLASVDESYYDGSY